MPEPLVDALTGSRHARFIAGWDQGVQGMQVGGRRQLVIAAGLAYGDCGAGHSIATGETLIFVCDLVWV